MNKIAFSFVALTSIFLLSCGHSFTDHQDEQIKKLELRLDSGFLEINAIDTSKAFASAFHFKENIAFFQSEMKDTITPQTAKIIDRYYSVKKGFILFQSTYAPTKAEFITLRGQIENLRHDASEGLLEQSQFDKYFHLESNNLILAEESLTQMVYAITTVQKIYDELNPKMDSIIAASISHHTASE